MDSLCWKIDQCSAVSNFANGRDINDSTPKPRDLITQRVDRRAPHILVRPIPKFHLKANCLARRLF
nr:hypothetical protein X990_5627 [Burkholderia pseudomallei MSHR4868]